MLAPGFSLSSLASTVGLAETKFVFPYGVLRGYGEALDEPALPPHGPRWFDVLRQRVTDEADVAEAHETFRRLGCSSVREYLEAYLRMDLRLLVASCHRLYDKFTELTGVPPVDSEKSTLSSYSMYCSQLFLASRGRPGSFCNNNPMLYAIVRSSLRGGLTLVARSSVNRGEEEGINEGAAPAPTRRPRSLHYLDVSGLYSAAGERSSGFGRSVGSRGGGRAGSARPAPPPGEGMGAGGRGGVGEGREGREDGGRGRRSPKT